MNALFSYDEIVRDTTASDETHFDWERKLLLAVYQGREYLSADHDVFHSLRVKRLAYRLCEEHPADREVLAAVAYLHDIASDADRHNHIMLAMEQASEILPDVGFPPEKLALVLKCIELHEDYNWASRKDYSQLPPEVLIFQDADRLDAIGAIGIARTFAFSAVHHLPMWIPSVAAQTTYDPAFMSRTTINHLHEKILRLGEIFNTEAAREIGRERTEFVRHYVERFISEWNGDDCR